MTFYLVPDRTFFGLYIRPEEFWMLLDFFFRKGDVFVVTFFFQFIMSRSEERKYTIIVFKAINFPFLMIFSFLVAKLYQRSSIPRRVRRIIIG